jgi:hypothetical protein
LLTQLDAAVGFRGVFIPAHHSAKPESCLVLLHGSFELW